MKNDIYASRGKGGRSLSSETVGAANPPVENVWVRSLRRQRIVNGLLLLLVFVVAALLVYIGFQQSVHSELEHGFQDQVAVRSGPRDAPDARGIQIRPLAALPGEDAQTGLMLDALRAGEGFDLAGNDLPFHMDWVKQATWHLLQAEEARRDEDWSRALAEFERVSQMFPRMAGVHGSKGLIEMQVGDYQAAVASFTAAIHVEGASAPLLNNQAVALIRLNRYEQAIEMLERATLADPEYTPAAYNLAVAHARVGNSEQALARFRAYLRRAPNDLDGTLAFSALLIDAGDWVGARELLSIADRMAPATPPILFRLAQAHAQTGQLRDALATLDRALNRADARQAVQWIGRREFDPLRDQPEFQRLLETLGD